MLCVTRRRVSEYMSGLVLVDLRNVNSDKLVGLRLWEKVSWCLSNCTDELVQASRSWCLDGCRVSLSGVSVDATGLFANGALKPMDPDMTSRKIMNYQEFDQSPSQMDHMTSELRRSFLSPGE